MNNRLTLFNKTIQTLIMSNDGFSLRLAFLLIDDPVAIICLLWFRNIIVITRCVRSKDEYILKQLGFSQPTEVQHFREIRECFPGSYQKAREIQRGFRTYLENYLNKCHANNS